MVDFQLLAENLQALADLCKATPGSADPPDPPVPMPTHINANGLQIIKDSESCRLKAYPDQGGKPTIGWGHTFGVMFGQTCTQAQADAWLVSDISVFEHGVMMAVAPETNENQFSALVSFAFNEGLGAFKSSTLLKLHNAGDYAGAAAQFPRWNLVKGAVSNGLMTRRAKERELYAS